MFKKSTIILAALCAVTMGMFVGCKHNTGDSSDPAPSLAGTWYSYEVVAVGEESVVEEISRAVEIATYVYSFNADGTLTAATRNGETVPGPILAANADNISNTYFRAVTLTDDGNVSSFIFRGSELVTPENASSFSYQVTDAGISVTVVFGDTPTTFVLQPGENGIYTLTDTYHDDDVTWKFKKAE